MMAVQAIIAHHGSWLGACEFTELQTKQHVMLQPLCDPRI